MISNYIYTNTRTSPGGAISVFVFKFILLSLLSQNINFGAANVIAIAEQKPLFLGMQCTSRTLPPDLGAININNATDDDALQAVTSTQETNGDTIYPLCPDGYYCDLNNIKGKDGSSFILGLCKSCSGGSELCIPAVPISTSLLEASGTSDPEIDIGLESIRFLLEVAVAEECQEQCGVEKNSCSLTEPCPNGLFCNFDGSGLDLSGALGLDGNATSGSCEECPFHMHFCENENRDKNLTDRGTLACQSACNVHCLPPSALKISSELPTWSASTSVALTSTEDSAGTPSNLNGIEGVMVIFGSPHMKATGPVVDCGLGVETCEGVEGAVCFIERGKVPFFNKTANCYAGGGVAAVVYNVEARCDNVNGTFNGAETLIPTVSLTHLEGKAILKQAEALYPAPLLATVEVGGFGILPETCWLDCTLGNVCEGTDLSCNFDNIDFGDCRPTEIRAACNDGEANAVEYLPCTADREYCDFSTGKRGFCNTCPATDGACFFSDLNSQGAFECADVCDANENLESAPCKFCPRKSFNIGDIGDGFISSISSEEEEVETPCEFCATTSTSTCSSVHRWDMEYPYRTIRMYGQGVECWAVAEFYRNLQNMEADNAKCDSARSFNYICGCSDSAGYAGANTEAKKLALEWMPRVGAILSMLGSTFMIIGVLRDEHRRRRVIGELIIFLCFFDIIGSIAYAFTTLPTHKEDYIRGAQGNQTTCDIQGFFIQFGTISLYINVSIAFYYLLIIRYSWREHRLRKSKVYPMLFVVPIMVGAIFAFAGIPFYDNTILWCNNSRKYWSEIPVIIAIAIATFIMTNLCWFVYKSERASRRFRRHNQLERPSLSKAFLLQSLVYLGAFYLTWPAYLVLQIMIARGHAFSYYWFFLFAGTAVTMQGFWNFTFHTGMHFRAVGRQIARVWTSVRNATNSKSFMLSSLMSKSQADHAEEPISENPVSLNPPAL